MPDVEYPAGRVTYSGAAFPQSGSYTNVLGVMPGIGSIVLAPQENATVAVVSNVVFTFEDIVLTLADCKADGAGFQRTTDAAKMWTLRFFDRRWKWEFPSTGIAKYNTLLEDGSVKSGTEKTTTQLVGLLLDFLGETGYTTAALPTTDDDGNTIYVPDIEWDYTPAAQELARILALLSCDVSLDHATNKIIIVDLSTGADLPTTQLMADSKGIDLPETADKVKVLAARSQYQADLELEAVALDINGVVQLIADVAYPLKAGGTGPPGPPNFSRVAEDYTTGGVTTHPRQLAKQTVFRWYRVSNNQSVTGIGAGLSRDSLLPLIPLKVDTMTSGGIVKRKPPEIYGLFQKVGWSGQDEATVTTWMGDFSIDEKLGIVKFADPVFLNNSGVQTEATIFLRCSVYGLDRYSIEQTIVAAGSELGTDYHHIKIDDVVGLYWDDNEDGTSTIQNGVEVNAVLTWYAERYAQDAVKKESREKAYNGIVVIPCDGKAHQVKYSVGATSAAHTIVSQNSETANPSMMPRKLRKLIGDMKRLING